MSVLSEVRKSLLVSGSLTEQQILSDSSGVRDLWEKVQALRLEMNQAKKAAAEEAARPYLEAIDKIERNHALILKLSSN